MIEFIGGEFGEGGGALLVHTVVEVVDKMLIVMGVGSCEG